jgi:hypothetical protein
MSAQEQQKSLAIAPAAKIIPLKIAWFGGQGSGKTTSAALLALALSKEVYGGAPVFVQDTEPGWQFLKRKLFDVEGVELIQRTDPTFKAMTASIREAERAGACVWNVDTLSVIWLELMQSFKSKNGGFVPINKWGDLREMWNKDYVTPFLNTNMCCQALGRLGNVTEEVQQENSQETKLVKTGTRFKAGGSEDFGYEPHLLLEVSLERKAKTVQGNKREGEGRMLHRVDVLKDRTWALNGKVFRWSDKPGYQKGGYRDVWQSLKPHWDAVQATAHVQIQTNTSSAALIASSGDSAYAARVKRVQITLEEFWETLATIWPGQDAGSKELRRIVVETVFGTRSRTAVESKALEELEWGLKILQRFEFAVKVDPRLLTDKTTAVTMLENLKAAPAEAEVQEDDDFAPRRAKTVTVEGMQVQ